MKNQKVRQDRGVAGLTILLSLVVMLFIIGLLVMIFALMGNELQDSTYTADSKRVNNETLASPTTAGITLTTGNNARNGVCGTLVSVYNLTGGLLITSANYTQTGCTVKNTTYLASPVTNYSSNFLYTYTYTYDADNTATDVMNDTTASMSGVTDWFDIFIVIGAMVVLILLTVIIVTAIRSSGMISSGSTAGANQVGTA